MERLHTVPKLAVVSAAVTELPPAALIERSAWLPVVKKYIPGVRREDLRQSIGKPIRARDLRDMFCYADDAVTACDALSLAVALVNMDHHAGRVFIDDLAEWLVVPPKAYRQITRNGWFAQASAAA